MPRVVLTDMDKSQILWIIVSFRVEVLMIDPAVENMSEAVRALTPLLSEDVLKSTARPLQRKRLRNERAELQNLPILP